MLLLKGWPLRRRPLARPRSVPRGERSGEDGATEARLKSLRHDTGRKHRGAVGTPPAKTLATRPAGTPPPSEPPHPSRMIPRDGSVARDQGFSVGKEDSPRGPKRDPSPPLVGVNVVRRAGLQPPKSPHVGGLACVSGGPPTATQLDGPAMRHLRWPEGKGREDRRDRVAYGSMQEVPHVQPGLAR